MKIVRPRQLGATALATVVTLALGAGRGSAHIDPDPSTIEAGATAIIGFTIEHGCDGSPTVDLQFQIPEGVTNAKPVDKDGWTATVTGDVIRFAGGSLPPEQEGQFEISLTAPLQAGDYRFPIIQTCATGELAWIEVAAEGAAEPERPAPTLTVTPAPATAGQSTAVDSPSSTAASSSTASPSTVVVTPATSPPDTTATSSTTGQAGTSVGTPSLVVASGDGDSSSNTGVVVAAIVAGALVVGGVITWLVRRPRPTRPS